MNDRTYSWRFAKAVFNSLPRDARRNEVLEELLGAGPRAVYAGLLMYARKKNYNPGWAAHAFREIYGTWPRPQDRRVEPEENFLIDEWASGRKRRRPSAPGGVMPDLIGDGVGR